MKTSEAIKQFKTQKGLAEALRECTQPAVAQWGEFPPPLRQLEIEQITKGALRAEPECDKFRFAGAI